MAGAPQFWKEIVIEAKGMPYCTATEASFALQPHPPPSASLDSTGSLCSRQFIFLVLWAKCACFWVCSFHPIHSNNKLKKSNYHKNLYRRVAENSSSLLLALGFMNKETEIHVNFHYVWYLCEIDNLSNCMVSHVLPTYQLVWWFPFRRDTSCGFS